MSLPCNVCGTPGMCGRVHSCWGVWRATPGGPKADFRAAEEYVRKCEQEAMERGESETGALGQDHPAMVAVVEAHRRACLCGSTTYEIVDVGDGLPRTDCCKAY